MDKINPLSWVCACFIAALLGFALYQGVDGICLSIGIGALAGLGGYTVKRVINK